MSREVVCTKLVLGIKTFGFEVIRPFLQLLPVKSGEIRVAVHLRNRADEQQEVTTLFNRHLVVHTALSITIYLTVGLRILPEIMRSKWKLPTIARRIIHEGHNERFRQRRPEQQELR